MHEDRYLRLPPFMKNKRKIIISFEFDYNEAKLDDAGILSAIRAIKNSYIDEWNWSHILDYITTPGYIGNDLYYISDIPLIKMSVKLQTKTNV